MKQGTGRWIIVWFPALAVCSGLALWLVLRTLQPASSVGESRETPPPAAKGSSDLTGNSTPSGPSARPKTDLSSLPAARGSELARREPETVAGNSQKEDAPHENPATGGDEGTAGLSSQVGPATATKGLSPTPGNAELVIPVPSGARVPAIFYDETPRAAPQQRMLDRIAREFNDAVSRAAPPGGHPSSQADLAEIWHAAAERADQQYINLYGFAAWHELHLRGAKEALRERKAAVPR